VQLFNEKNSKEGTFEILAKDRIRKTKIS